MSVAAVQEAPGRRSRWMVDVAHVMGTKGILPFLTETWRQYGDFSQIQIGPRTMHLAVHPEHARHISITNRDNYDKRASYDIVRRLLLGDGLVASTGDLWRRQRSLMAPFFTPKSVEQYAPLITADGLELARRWEALAATGKPIERIDEMMLVTASIILRTVFSMAPW